MSATRNRTMLVVGVIVAVLLAAVLVVGVLILNGMNPPSEEDRFWSCMNSQGFERDKTLADSGKTVDEYQAAADECEAA